MSFVIDSTGPMPCVPYPNLRKIQACVSHLLQAGPQDEARIHAAMFLASSAHLRMFGRPVVGDTWIRGMGHCGVFGVVLSSVLGHMKTAGDRRHFTPDSADRHVYLTEILDSTPKLQLQLCASEEYIQTIVDGCSPTDLDALDAALACVDSNVALDVLIARVTTDPLYGSGAVGTMVDWAAGLSDDHAADDEYRSDLAFTLLHCG